MSHPGEAPTSSNDTTINGVQKPMVTYNLDDLAFPTFVLRTLKIIVPTDVRTWRELTDYVRANLRILPPLTLESILKIQTDYSNAGPAERTRVPAMIPTVKHVPVRGGKGRGGTTHRGAVTATSTNPNINVPGAAQSQGLAQIATAPRESPPENWRKEAIPANVGVTRGVATDDTREQQLQTPRKEAITAGVSAVRGRSREYPTQALRKENTPAKTIALPRHLHTLPQGSRKEAIPNESPAPCAHREQPSQAWLNEATSANSTATPGAHRQHPAQASRKDALPANWSAAPRAHPEHPSQAWRNDATPTNTAASGAHREHPSQASRKDALPANWSAGPRALRENPSPASSWRKENVPVNLNVAPGAHREHSLLTSRNENVPANSIAAPGAHHEHPSPTPRKETAPVNLNAAPGAHRKPPSVIPRKENVPVIFNAASAAYREHVSKYSRHKEDVQTNWSAAPETHHEPPSVTSRKETIPVNFYTAPSAHREHVSQVSRLKEAIQANWSAEQEALLGNSPEVWRESAVTIDWSAARRAQRENSSQDSRQEAEPMNLSASSGLSCQPPSESPSKEAIPATVGAGPAILMHGTSKQNVVGTATGAGFEQAKPAKEASQGMQKPATGDTSNGDQTWKSVSVNLNNNEKARFFKSSPKAQVIEKGKAEREETVLPPMGDLIDLSVPTNASSPPQSIYSSTQGRHLSGYTTTGGYNTMMPGLATIPALTPVKQTDSQSLTQSPQPRMPYRVMLPPEAPPTLSRNSSSTRSRSPSIYTRTPSPEKPKAKNPELPKQAGRYYLVHKNGGVDYVWVAGAQRGDPCPPHLNPVE